jgi:protein TonB
MDLPMESGARASASTRVALVVALAAAGACASAPPPALPEPQSPPQSTDALPSFYEEDQVDVPARPVAPIEPTFPARLRALGVEGVVAMRVVVLADGSAGPTRLLESSHPEFTDSVQKALREARFLPARRDGRSVSSWLTIRIDFRLEE